MKTDINTKALAYHAESRPGKIEVSPIKSCASEQDLAMAASPGVAAPCLKIRENGNEVYRYTIKGNLVGIITNGSEVLSLGNLGALAAKPVMEGKAMLFKKYADIDAFDIELNTTDIDMFVRTVITMSPSFGAINLEDIKAPECFEIEKRLIDVLDIPVMHNNQHGTAIVVAAGLLNACELTNRQIDQVKLVINGAGAAAMACADMFIALGLKKENLIMLDNKGVISQNRIDLDRYKQKYAINTPQSSLTEAVLGADAFIGLSKANIMTQEMLKSMAAHPIVFALANPNPEIAYNDAVKAKYGIVYGSGRSDIPNQLDNVLSFPYVFRAAMDVWASEINMEMKKAAVYALAALAKSGSVEDGECHDFSKDYFIPKPSDNRLLTTIVPAVVEAAMKTGVALNPVRDIKKYVNELENRIN